MRYDAWQALMDGETGIRLIREALEGMVEPRVASVLVFEALASGEALELPASAKELIEFARGPLHDAVERRVGLQDAAEVVERVEAVFERFAPVQPPGAAATLEVFVGAGPVRVLVVSSHPPLAVALRASLGGEAVEVLGASDLEGATRLVQRTHPELLIVDALSPIEDDTTMLVALLARAGEKSTLLIWGAERRWGADVTGELDARSVSYTPVDRREGVAPLLDFIRSRFRAC